MTQVNIFHVIDGNKNQQNRWKINKPNNEVILSKKPEPNCRWLLRRQEALQDYRSRALNSGGSRLMTLQMTHGHRSQTGMSSRLYLLPVHLPSTLIIIPRCTIAILIEV